MGGFNPSFKPGGLALFTLTYLVLMSLGAGVAIPGGLFMPSVRIEGMRGAVLGACSCYSCVQSGIVPVS